ncbi:TonB-dependent receptor [Alcanivorax marinus]|uniref:TonB-dependent receptor n=2 Tax=Alloalcanivorax marinus TaxID=1177169 RepID=A0A9Q3UQW2_9GAMM|nr:TonB-dependent receptor [Alloalcanivorax marinus]MCC4309904.1 TonB-dependent receptor [Alloalcanivorax marinus]MCU5786451.1 putative TonB dependent/ligand-Gated channel [Alloalcanivorax marinus]
MMTVTTLPFRAFTTPLAGLLMGLLLSLSAAADPAGPRHYDVPPGPLAPALHRFAGQAGVTVQAAAGLLDDRLSPGLSGDFTVADGLRRLLAGTGLGGSAAGPDLYVIRPISGQVLDRVEVTGGIGASPAMALPVPYQGGQLASGGQVGLLGNKDYMDAPVNITSYTRETIDNLQARTMAEMVRNDPSVRGASGAGGMLDSFFIRGFAMNEGNSGEVSYNGVYGVAPNYRVLTGYAERVEVLKGPSTLLHGLSPNGSVGGTINVVSKRAPAGDLNRVEAQYTQDLQFGGSVDLSRRAGEDDRWGMRFNAGYTDGDTRLDDQQRASGYTALALDYQGERLRASLDLLAQREDYDAPSRELMLADGVPLPSAPDGRRNVTQEWEWSRVEDRSLLLSAEYDLSEHLMAFANLGGGDSEVDRLFGYPTIQNAEGDTRDSPSYMLFRNQRRTADAGLRALFDTAGVAHELSVQVNGYREKYRRGAVYASASYDSNIYEPVSRPELAVARPAHIPDMSESKLSGPALADTLSFLDRRLQVTLGARRQRIETDNFNAAPGSRHYDESETALFTGLVVSPWSGVSFYGNYTEGLSRGEIAPAAAANAGQALAPYVAKQYEAGIKLDRGGLAVTLDAFQITRPYSELNGDNVYRAGGEQRNRGLEAMVFGELGERLRVMTGAMVMDAELTRARDPALRGNKPVGVPDFQANATAEWDPAALPGLTLLVSASHTGEQYLSNRNRERLPSWTTWDLGARYQSRLAGTPVTWRLTVQNVGDKAYWASVNSWSMLTVGAPRTAVLSVTADF